MTEATRGEIIELKGKELVYKNFTGKNPFSLHGSFGVIVSEEEARYLSEKGVRVRETPDRKWIEIRTPASRQSEFFHLDNEDRLGPVDVTFYTYDWRIKDKSGTVLYLDELSFTDLG